MSTKKSGGSSSNQAPPRNPKHLGLKKSGGQKAVAGNILITQHGNKYYPGKFVGQGRNFTLFAKKDGSVKFNKGYKNRVIVSIE